MADAVRTHLIADHKRSPAEADELIARFNIAQPIPEARRSGGGRSRDGGAAAPDVSVN
jgi:hypothetical protein